MGLKLQLLKSRKGFTLIEILISIALMAVISVPIGASLIFGLRVYDTEIESDRSFQKQQDVLLVIKNQIRTNPTAVKIVKLENGSLTLEPGNEDKKISYYQDGQKLYRLENTTLTEVLSDVVTFDLRNAVISSNNQLLSFTLELVCASNGRNQTLVADFALDRY